jgi:hypothetical protein
MQRTERNLRPWTGDPPTTEEEAYNLAVEGYTFPNLDHIGTLTSALLRDLALQPPNVDYQTWDLYRQLSPEQLYAEAMGIDQLVPGITPEQVLFFLTHDMPQLRTQLYRWQRYGDLTSTSQDLINLIYGDQLGYARAERTNFWEPFILQYDVGMGDANDLYRLGVRLGARVPPYVDADLYLYDILERAIRYPDSTPQQIVQLRGDNYRAYFTRVTGLDRDPLLVEYDTRLSTFLNAQEEEA